PVEAERASVLAAGRPGGAALQRAGVALAGGVGGGRAAALAEGVRGDETALRWRLCRRRGGRHVRVRTQVADGVSRPDAVAVTRARCKPGVVVRAGGDGSDLREAGAAASLAALDLVARHAHVVCRRVPRDIDLARARGRRAGV